MLVLWISCRKPLIYKLKRSSKCFNFHVTPETGVTTSRIEVVDSNGILETRVPSFNI